jgi:hypothetical protein
MNPPLADLVEVWGLSDKLSDLLDGCATRRGKGLALRAWQSNYVLFAGTANLPNGYRLIKLSAVGGPAVIPTVIK